MAGAARVSEFFFTKNPNLKKKIFFFWWWCGGGIEWMDSRTGPNQFVPFTSSKLGHNNALMYMLYP